MKPGLPTPPPDDANDPLLAALRQHLGPYGQAPPPAAWAAIRQQLPQPAPVRPWWYRRRLLALLGLLLGLVAVGTLAVRHGLRLPGAGRAGQVALAQPTTGTEPSLPSGIHPAALPKVMNAPLLAGSSAQPATSSHLLPSARRNVLAPGTTTGAPTTFRLASAARSGAARQTRHHRATAPDARQRFSQADKAEVHALAAKPPVSPGAATRALVHSVGSAARLRARARRATTSASHPAPLVGELVSRSTAGRRGRHQPAAPLALAARPHRLVNTAGSTLVDSLQLKQIALAGTGIAAPLPVVLVALPADSVSPAALPERRWSLLLLAGPTVSYRTLGPAPALPASRPDFARLERPALGLGAQVQVRRALTNRWALAVGLGYQEYATQLALTHPDSAAPAVHLRDTYRLLTLPVQLSYRLGAPRGRLSWALLAGAEPGWYQGGRSTEGSTCSCQQQVYPAATLNPYRSWNVALSLGLDLRYQLGGAASRWRWVVQPTGRYVASPFVRSEALGYTSRQPFSLGVLAGFSWDVR
ncbi:MAG: outer membrane beta-barrel protein [Janthinobacterium lividum]